ncbi:MAG: hypothetical protein IIZ27_09380 [Solobacterium sp.]|nr:hypothetical protein [Solobacterium sp.]MBR2670180.1 hypothetical protein [Solobacterium sp.]
MSSKYEDILYLPHHVSKVHPQMSRADRAAQFAPFAALTGYDSMVKETARLTDKKIEQDENERENLDRILQYLKTRIEEQPKIIVTYFEPDEYKQGGRYVTRTILLKAVDEITHTLVSTDRQYIPAEDILDIQMEEEE